MAQVGADPSGVPGFELLKLAQLCIACRIKHRQIELAYLDKLPAGQTRYKGLVSASGKCEPVCRKMIDLCLADSQAARAFALDCAKALEACAKECEGVREDKPLGLASACREAARACRGLGRSGAN